MATCTDSHICFCLRLHDALSLTIKIASVHGTVCSSHMRNEVFSSLFAGRARAMLFGGTTGCSMWALGGRDAADKRRCPFRCQERCCGACSHLRNPVGGGWRQHGNPPTPTELSTESSWHGRLPPERCVATQRREPPGRQRAGLVARAGRGGTLSALGVFQLGRHRQDAGTAPQLRPTLVPRQTKRTPLQGLKQPPRQTTSGQDRGGSATLPRWRGR